MFFINFFKYIYFSTNNVNNMRVMFNKCSKLSSLYLSNFNTNNAINIQGIFQLCSSLTSLDLSNFNTHYVTDMSYMFCRVLL